MKNRTQKTFLFSLLGFAKHQKMPLFGAITLGTLGHFTAIAIPSLAAVSLCITLGFYPNLALSKILVLIGICGILRGVLHYGEQWLNHYLAFHILADIRDEIFDVLRKLAPAKLEGRDKGDLINLITSDIEKMEVFFAHTLSPVGIAFFVNVSISLVFFTIDWKLGCTGLFLYLMVAVLIPYVTMKLSGDVALNFRDKSSDLSSFTLESIQGMKELLQYEKTGERLEQARIKNKELEDFGKKINKNTSKTSAVTYTILMMAHLSFLLVGSRLVKTDTLSFDVFLVTQVLFMSSFGPVLALANLGSTLQGTFASGKRVLALGNELPQVAEVHEGKNIEFHGATAENVNFSYDSVPVLKGLSLKIPENKIIGIQGASGCGKSTFLRLLMRFWDVDTGEISLSGENIKDINTSNLRSQESFVTQETHLFSRSIGENILIANPTATKEEVEIACEKASIHEFILSLEEGYDTQVGHLGSRLSGGERQRIGLARAFLHNAPLLLLDEPTSNLDSLNEGAILQSIYQESLDKTVVLVSHRLTTLSQSDLLVQMEEGKVLLKESKSLE
ncbi:MAG: ABC transporter ATP-binding protein [Eubacteriales bacterium]